MLRILQLGTIDERRFSSWDMLNISGAGIPDIRIQDLIEDVMKSALGDVFAEAESRPIILEMLEQMSKLHRGTSALGVQKISVEAMQVL